MKRLLGDVRALGWWAPVRAAYELDRRMGLTGRLLRRRRPRVPRMASPFPPGPLPGTGTGWTESADDLLTNGARYFGRSIDLRGSPQWNRDADGNDWPLEPWWRIDIHEEPDRDVKLVWEPARHRHLVVLARAAAESPSPGRYIDRITDHVLSFVDQSPAEVGVHWMSNLEISLRALAWLEVFHVAGDHLGDAVREAMASTLYHSGRHIVAELPYTISSMRNNHLIGDAVGLVGIGRAFPGDRRARRWSAIGDRLLRRHVPRHVHGDGSSLEDSLGYRAFVTELLALRAAMRQPPSSIERALELSAANLARLGVGAGPVPRFGDWDGGSAMPGPPDLSPPASSVTLALRGSSARARPVDDGSDAGGGMGRIAKGPWAVWLKAGGAESHQHSDLLSTAVSHRDVWVVGDPGNGSYNRSMEERDYFRTSTAHSVLRIEGRDQRVPHRRFRWRFSPSGRLGGAFDAGEFRVMWGTHDAYERLEPRRSVLRACLVSDTAVVVADWIVGGHSDWALSLPLGPKVVVDGDPDSLDLRLAVGGEAALAMRLPGPAVATRGARDPLDGWWAEDYDYLIPATRLEVIGRGSGPVVWAVWDGPVSHIATEGTTLVVDDHRIGPGSDRSGRPTVELVGGGTR